MINKRNKWVFFEKKKPPNNQIVNVMWSNKQYCNFKYIENYGDKIGNNVFIPIDSGNSFVLIPTWYFYWQAINN
jgi:hypothetical protein